ncbi:MAG: cation:proton antiporter [Pseudomonadota bacterium]
MSAHSFDITVIALIFTGAAVLATTALFARQSLIVGYMILGVLLGPSVFGLVSSTETIQEIGHVGIVFLLFLLGLNLPPQKLAKLLGEVTLVTVANALVLTAVGAAIAVAFGFDLLSSVLIGCTLSFSSTIIALKLLPTSTLHHQRMGEVIIGVLLLQDLMAIVLLLVVQGFGPVGGESPGVTSRWSALVPVLVWLPLFILAAVGGNRFVLVPLLRRFDTIQEYIFVIAIGWCLGCAQLASMIGLSYEIGAFIAGVAMATHPISAFVAEKLQPVRDFFLILFFFSLGASFDLGALPSVALPACALAVAVLLVKPWLFRVLLLRAGERPGFSREVGLRLGQASEFSLMLAVLALGAGILNARAAYLIQTTTMITFVISAYWVMLRCPTPIALDDNLRRN